MKYVRLVVLAVLGTLAGCSGGGASTGPGNNGTGGTGGTGGGGGGGSCPANSVCMLSASFTPATLTVSTGTTVAFVNNSGVAHDVAFDGTRPPGVSDIPLHTSGTNDRQFTAAGTFGFHCNQHAGMNGQIVVN